MGGKPSACVDHLHRERGSDDQSGSSTERSTSSRLRKRIGGLRGGGGSRHRFLKEEQFSGIAKIQLISVCCSSPFLAQFPNYFSSSSLLMSFSLASFVPFSCISFSFLVILHLFFHFSRRFVPSSILSALSGSDRVMVVCTAGPRIDWQFCQWQAYEVRWLGNGAGAHGIQG